MKGKLFKRENEWVVQHDQNGRIVELRADRQDYPIELHDVDVHFVVKSIPADQAPNGWDTYAELCEETFAIELNEYELANLKGLFDTIRLVPELEGAMHTGDWFMQVFNKLNPPKGSRPNVDPELQEKLIHIRYKGRFGINDMKESIEKSVAKIKKEKVQ